MFFYYGCANGVLNDIVFGIICIFILTNKYVFLVTSWVVCLLLLAVGFSFSNLFLMTAWVALCVFLGIFKWHNYELETTIRTKRLIVNHIIK